MNYTIKIAENENEGEILIRQIKELVGDSPFVSIYEEETGLSDDMVQELERRYQQVIKNPQDGKSWEEVKKDLLNR
ncbi:MAG: addiction module protein [Bacteroidota bacterium]|nr:addiction module protein [Bacteroidota bacterium]